MLSTISGCCFTYNHLLEYCNKCYENGKKHPSRFDLQKLLPSFKKEHPELKDVYAQVLCDVPFRLSKAFDLFFGRLKAKGGKAGLPRFKSFSRYGSFTYSQYGFHIKDKRLHLSKIGEIRASGFRKMWGILKTCTIKREGHGPHYRWKAILTYDFDEISSFYIADDRTPIGIDLGLSEIVVTSENERYVNKHRYAKSEKDIAKIQRKMSKYEKGSQPCEKYKQQLFHKFTKLKNRQRYDGHRIAYELTERHNIIVFEDISASKLQEKSLGKSMTKSYRDASWAHIVNGICIKAEEAECRVLKVNPAYTSQMCSRCGELVKKDLSVRTHHCPHCGLDIDRDLNASKNILRFGLEALRQERRTERTGNGLITALNSIRV